MMKLKKINGFARTNLDKLLNIRADFVRLENNLEEKKFG